MARVELAGLAIARAVAERYGARFPEEAVATLLAVGGADRVVLPPATGAALEREAAGWRSVIVPNGRTGQQAAKLRHTGLDALLHGWVISESAGHNKPAPGLLRAAGAHALGIPTVWILPGAPWLETGFRPIRVAPDAAVAIDSVIGVPLARPGDGPGVTAGSGSRGGCASGPSDPAVPPA